jgi:hypothetical protein
MRAHTIVDWGHLAGQYTRTLPYASRSCLTFIALIAFFLLGVAPTASGNSDAPKLFGQLYSFSQDLSITVNGSSSRIFTVNLAKDFNARLGSLVRSTLILKEPLWYFDDLTWSYPDIPLSGGMESLVLYKAEGSIKFQTEAWGAGSEKASSLPINFTCFNSGDGSCFSDSFSGSSPPGEGNQFIGFPGYPFVSIREPGQGDPGLGALVRWDIDTKHPSMDYQGTFGFRVSGLLARTYQAKSRNQYIYDALVANRSSNLTDGEIAQRAYSEIFSELREFDAETSNKNLELRGAEYFLRDYRGVVDYYSTNFDLLNLANELGDRGGPLALVVYNAVKKVKGSSIGGAGALPASPPGGLDDALDGFSYGTQGYTVDDLIRLFDPANPQPRVRSKDTKSFDVLHPTLGVTGKQLTVDGEEISLSLFGFDVSASDGLIYLSPNHVAGTLNDPVTARALAVSGLSEPTNEASHPKTYGFSISDNLFTEVVFVADEASQLGHVEINFLDRSFLLTSGQVFSFAPFADLFGGGLDAFSIGGPNFGASNIVFGLGFLNDGEALVGIASSNSFSASVVPLPPALPLILASLAFLGTRVRLPGRTVTASRL